MSVINQMLNDIEQREQSQQDKSTQKLDYLEVDEPRHNGKWVIAILTVCIIAIALWVSKDSLMREQTPSNPMPVVEPEAEPQLPITEESIAADTILLSKNEAKEETAITAGQELKPVPVVVEQQKLVTDDIVVKKPPATPVNKTPIVAKQQSHLSIKPIKLSAPELAKLKYQQGLKQQNKGDLAKAQQSWREALVAQPNLHGARESLAASFYGANQVDNALAILQQGTALYPDYENYRILMAQILFKQQRAKAALEVLDQPHKNKDASNEALALAGAIAQSLMLWPQAQHNYQALYARQPQYGKWLIGLAISLDAQSKQDAAQQHYQEFLRLPNVDSSLSQYAQERLKQIKKKIQIREHNG